MKAIVLEKPEYFTTADIPEPAGPGEGEALVRVHRVGICGTDYSGYLGRMPFYSYPRIPGHELGVEVVSVGEGVSNVRAGDKCSVEPYINCQECYSCRRGATNCCENLQVLGVHTDGGLRPHFVVPARKLHPSSELSLEQLALVETLAIGCHAVNRGGPKPPDDVLVIGAGPIGLSVIEFVKLSGANCIVMDLSEDRLRFCEEKMGISKVIRGAGEEANIEAVRQATHGSMAQVVIDATGSQQSMSAALKYASFTGRVIYVGITTAEVSFGHPLMHRREISVQASRNALAEDFKRIIGLIEEGEIDTTPWITHRAPFDQMIGEFASWLKPENRVIKAMVSLSE